MLEHHDVQIVPISASDEVLRALGLESLQYDVGPLDPY